MVDFSPKEKYKEVKEIPPEHTGKEKELSIEERLRREEEEKNRNKPVRLEQEIQTEEPEPVKEQEIFSYQANTARAEYTIGDTSMEKFWEEKKKEQQKGEEEEKRKRQAFL